MTRRENDHPEGHGMLWKTSRGGRALCARPRRKVRRNEDETKKGSGRACMLKEERKAEDERSCNRQIDEIVKEKITVEARKCQGGSGPPGVVPGEGEESKKVQES